jgi:hypothetical protein
MNIAYTDYTDFPNKPEACMSFDNENIKKDISNKFNKDYNREDNDVFKTDGSFRQFYTNPCTTIPNDQTAFAKWLYEPRYIFKKEN